MSSNDSKLQRWLRPVLVVLALFAVCLFMDVRDLHPLPWAVVYIVCALIVIEEFQRAMRHDR